MANIISRDGRHQLWLHTSKASWIKFELNDSDDGKVSLEIWSQDNQVHRFSFPSTSKFLGWCDLLKQLGEAKLADDAKRAADEKNARVVSIDKHLE